MNKLVNCGLENRFGTNCLKWDGLKSRFGNENLIAMWVADMDFKSSAASNRCIKRKS